MIEDMYIINNIISYLNIHEKRFINKYHYYESKGIRESKANIIKNFYLKNKLRLEYSFEQFDNLQLIKNYYILFYPKCYKKAFIQLALNLHILNFNRTEFLILNNIYKNALFTNNYNEVFKYVINQLTLTDFAIIGW